VDDARRLLFDQSAEAVRNIQGSFALLARSGKTVKMARSLDRPMRYFLAKRSEGPALVVAPRIDAIFGWLKSEGLDGQFHPSYTRMVPAHHVVELQLIGCPDPDPVYTRFFTPPMATLPANLDEIGRAYIAALSEEVSRWLRGITEKEPIGVCFSGGIDSGSVFLTTYFVMRKLGMNPARLKAFTLDLGDGPDLDQAHAFLDRLGLSLFLEPIEASASAGGLMMTSTPSSNRVSSASVTRQAISMRASRSMSSPVISQSIHTSRSFTLIAYDLGCPAWPTSKVAVNRPAL